MTVTHIPVGYLEDEYMEDAYLAEKVKGHMGFQATIVNTDKQNPLGVQSEITINKETPLGFEARIVNTDFQKPLGFEAAIDNTGFQNPLGIQASIFNIDKQNPIGFEAVIDIDVQKIIGMEGKIDTLSHISHGKYLNEPYLSEAYLSEKMCAFLGMQANIDNVDQQTPIGFEALIQNVDFLKQYGFEALIINTDFLNPFGVEALIIQTVELGFQANINLYNDKKLRILCTFPSRGTASGNWTASSTEPGDFIAENMDTDITEEIWRSATGVTTGITLTDDIGIGQNLFLDTFAMLGHNLTTSATVRLDGADNAGFAPIGFTEVLEVTSENMYYIAPTLPTDGFRYWRITIDDVTNSDGFISVGSILFGAGDIFGLDCGFTDTIRFERRDFTDKIQTEGFTNISNSRALKKVLGLEFRSIESRSRSFILLKRIFETFRTTHKCLWIPTPSSTDQTITGKFAVFGKLVRLPSEQHNNKGEPDNDYVSFTIDIDESL